MFDRVAGHYDLLNDLLSWGLDRWWRRTTARAVASPSEPGDWVLDLGCGSGRLGLLLAGRMRVAGVDLSHSMLVAGRREARRRGERMAFVEGSAGARSFVTQRLVLSNLQLVAQLAKFTELIAGAALLLASLGRLVAPATPCARSRGSRRG